MNNERTTIKKLFIFICFVITCLLVYYHSQQSQVESGNIYISGAVQDNGQTNWTKTGEKTTWNTDLNVGENQNSLIKLRTWSIEPTHSEPIQSLQLMSKDVRVYVKGFPEDSFANNVATYVYWISDWDIDFLATLKAENGWFDMFKQSDVWYISHYVCKDNLVVSTKDYIHIENKQECKPIKKREDSRWLCQLHRAWHRDIVDDPRFWTDWKRQVEQCYKKYKWWTKFYGYYVRHKYKNDFTIIN